MKNFLILIALSALVVAGAAQTKKPETKKTTAAAKSPTPAKKPSTAAKKTPVKMEPDKQNTAASKTTTKKPAAPKKDDKGLLEKALANEKPDDKVTALTKFLSVHPKSELRPRALESLTAARALAAESKFEAGERDAAIKLYRAAIKDAPLPYPERLFNEVISKIPQALYFRGEQAAAIEVAAAIEANSASSAPQLLAVAGSYLMMENGSEAMRIAEAAMKLDEKSAAPLLVLGMAHRLNFDLESSAGAFAKALELDPESIPARRGLAELKRALGKPAEALALFDELLAKDAEDFGARNGRILSLFAAGKRSDAETEFSKAIEANPSNVPLIAGAAYFYAANGDSEKAIDLAGKAIAADPRFIWSHIALARGYLAAGRFSDAEQVLLNARKYGNFATLEYEIAAARLAGGFYREAAEELQKSFVVKDGMVSTKLGRRVERAEKSFADLVAFERRASILEPKGADTIEQAETLKALLEFHTFLSTAQPDQTKAGELADAFVKGNDKMRYHRQIYAANELLKKEVAPAKAIELSKAAVASVDDGLAVSIPAAPIMASEMYPNRVAAINADKYILVPEVPKPTLSAIARGRIEELAGWSFIQQGSNADAVIRLRRAVSILPEKSVWWRSSYWRLGQALEAEGKDKDALDAYVKSYTAGEAESAKYAAIESIYRKTNGNTDGLEGLIGSNPTRPEDKKQGEKLSVVAETKAEAKTNENPPVLVSEKKTEEKLTETKKEENPIVLTENKTEVKTNENPPVSVPVKITEEKPAEVKKEEPKNVPVPEVKTETSVIPPASTPETKSEEKPPEVKKEGPKNVPVSETKPDEKANPISPAVRSDEKPVEVKQEEPKNEPVPETKKDETKVNSSASTSGSKSDEKPVELKKEKPGTEEKQPLFEPVVIQIKRDNPAAKKKSDEKIVSDETKVTIPSPEKEKDGDEEARNTTSPGERPRVIEGKEIKAEGSTACGISLSQENVSLIGGGGSIGLLVGIDGNADVKQIAALSSSPKDIEVVPDPDFSSISGKKILFVIKSLTPSTGVYQVVFSAPCGKKELVVKVR